MSLPLIETKNCCQLAGRFIVAGLFALVLPASAQNSAASSPGKPASSERIKNPFVFQTTDNGQGLIPVGTGRLPQSMRLAAVLISDHGDALAALRLPGESAPVFVRVDDLISVNFPDAGTVEKARARSTATVPEQAPVYLLIKSISATGVEVAPRVRPSEVHLIR